MLRIKSGVWCLVLVMGAVGCNEGRSRGGSGGQGSGGNTGGGGGAAPDGGTADISVAGTIATNRPELRPLTDALVAGLKVPPDFRVALYGRDLGNPRMMARGPDGSIYVTMPMSSRVIRLMDVNADGDVQDAGENTVVASAAETPGLEGVHGIAVSAERIFLASVKSVFAGTLSATGTITGLQKVIADLPDGGQHANRTLGVGPDGNLYVSVGSACNACPESNSEHATLLRVTTAGAAASNPANPQHPMLARNPMAMVSPRVFASGLRNTIGFAWHPSTMALWGADIGSDGLGDDRPFDELNLIDGGKSYGWPYCWGQRQIDPVIDAPSPTLSKEQYCATTTPTSVGFPAHTSPIGFVFYTGTAFPEPYRGSAFAALRGSWNRSQPGGYKVVRIRFEAGAPTAAAGQSSPIEDFLTGFLVEGGAAHFGRIAGLAIDSTGALLVSDDTNGAIYRVTYMGSASDAGTASDGGTTSDGGTASDGGTTPDAGTASDAGTGPDGGTAPDAAAAGG